MNRIAIVHDPKFLSHSNGPGHPESPERLPAPGESKKSGPYSVERVISGVRSILSPYWKALC